MKKKLLITLGCSGTEGIGCFPMDDVDTSLNYNRNTYHLTKKYSELRSNSIVRCHELGWPNRLGKKLGFDMVLNLGLRGSSTSGQLKVFVEKYLDTDFSDWEVLIFWHLTESSRFSFYSHGKVRNMTITQESSDASIESGYLKLITDINVDPILEQIFYIKLLEQICENKEYNLLISHGFGDQDPLIKGRYQSKNYLSPYPINLFSLDESQYDEFLSPYCWHPNEFGYELLSQNIYEEIKKNHPKYINPPKENIEWKWDGMQKEHLIEIENDINELPMENDYSVTDNKLI